ncbi:hypothetical protein MJH12_17100, partial [bacterium]|nr:hypothetical protein [bacterium]
MQKIFLAIVFSLITILSVSADDQFNANLHKLVLQSLLLENHPSLENSNEYISVFDKIYKEILPNFDEEPDEKLISFYEFISKYDVSKMKYFVPLLKRINKNLKLRILDGEEGIISDHHEVLNDVLESIESKVEIFQENTATEEEVESPVDEQATEGNSEDEVEEGSEEESESDVEEDPEEESDSETEENSAEFEVDEINALKEEIKALKTSIENSLEEIGSLQDEVRDLKKNESDIDQIEEKLEKVAQDKELVLQELASLKEKMDEYENSKQAILDEIEALKEKLGDFPEMPTPPSPAPKPAPKPEPSPAPKPT